MKGKKTIIAVSALLGAAALLGGCQPKHNKAYDTLNAMRDYNYSQIVLTVTSDFGGDAVLVSEYTMKFTENGATIDYSVERFTELTFDSAAPVKTTLTGSAIVWADGDAIGIGSDDEANLGELHLEAVVMSTGFDFKEEYFENANLTEAFFMADVKNPSAFMGAEIACTEMRIRAIYLNRFNEIKIDYKTQDGALVQYKYAFKG